MKPTCRSRTYRSMPGLVRRVLADEITICIAPSAQSVVALDLILGQAAHARQRPSAIGNRNGHHDLIRPGCVGNADLHAIEMATDVCGILVAQRDIERHTRPAALLRRRYERRALAEHLPHRSSQFGVKDRCRMLQLAVLPHRGSLAVTLGPRSFDADGVDSVLRKQSTQLLTYVDELLQVFHVAAGEGVLNHCDGDRAPHRRIHHLTHLGAGFFDGGNDFADFGFHLRPSSPFTSLAFSPPTRAWMRGPVVITNARAISSAFGPSVTPISIASKWLRT